MNIKSIRVIPLGYPLPESPTSRRAFALVRVETDSGVVGYGEGSTSYGHFYPTVMTTIVDDILAPVLIGKDVLQIRERIKDMQRYLYPWLGIDGISSQVIAAVEIALWDIQGRVMDKPIHALLGGKTTNSFPLYWSGPRATPGETDFQKVFDPALELGFVGVKTRIGYRGDIKSDMDQVEAVREHIGPDLKLMVDAYWNYGVESASRLAQFMGDLDVFWFEEPIPQAWINGLAKLRGESPVPIAVGERVYSARSFGLLADYGAADYWQPDATVAAGILECLDVVALAKVNDVRVFPHIGGLTAVGQAANMHFGALVDDVILEFGGEDYQPLRDDILRDPILDRDHIRDGKLTVPDGPGLGIEIDESKFEKYAYRPGGIHPDLTPTLGAGNL